MNTQSNQITDTICNNVDGCFDIRVKFTNVSNICQLNVYHIVCGKSQYLSMNHNYGYDTIREIPGGIGTA